MALMAMAGRRYFAIRPEAPLVGFTIALLISTLSMLSIGSIVASLVPTARFAQPVGAIVFHPMIGLSGLFVPIASLPQALHAVSMSLPRGEAASLLQGIWTGDPWSAHRGDVAALLVVFIGCTAISAREFRWE